MTPSLSGTQLGDYRLDHRLGVGGMAEVWSVEDNPGIAVKLLSVQAAQVARLARAVRTEVQVAAGLCHPNIVGILATGEVQLDGVQVPWIAMERGEYSLAEAQQVEVLQVLRDVLRGLAHAHAHGVLHRDVKPGNVLRLGDRWVLSDFGLASTERTDAQLGGSPGYAAPEQARGAVWEEGPWTDLYGVGALAWALCTGKAPDHPSDLSGGTVPQALAPWIQRAGSYRSSDRFFHAADALASLPEELDPQDRVALARSSSDSSTQYFLHDAPLQNESQGSPQAALSIQIPPLPATPPPDTLPVGVAPSVAALVPPPLPGQQEARSALWQGLRRADNGERTVVVIDGAPGSGRHPLVTRVLAKADELGSATVIRMRASPTRPVRTVDLARRALGALDGSPAETERVAIHWGIDDPALPELLDPWIPRIRLHTPSAQHAALGRALAVRARHRVLVIAIEEAQYSLDGLWMATEYLESLPPRTLLVLTTTSGGSAPARALLDMLPTPTSMCDVAFGPSGTAEPWQDALDAHRGMSPPAQRLNALTERSRRVIEVAALLGRDVEEDLWIAICEATARPDPRDALPELLAAGWVERERGDCWLFRSRAMRQVATRDLSDTDRTTIHTAAAEALADRPPSRARAEHLLAIGERLLAARAWYHAYQGHSALRALALAELEDRVAIEPPDRVCALALAMRIHVASMADAPEHEALYKRLKAHVDKTPDPVVQSLLHFARAWRTRRMTLEETSAMVDSRCLIDVPDELDAYWPRSQFTLLQSDLLGHVQRLDEAIEAAELAREQATEDTHWVNATLHLAHYLLDQGKLEQGRTLLDEIGLRTHHMSGSMLSVYHQVRGFIAEREGDIQEAEREMRASIELRDQMHLAAPFGRVNHAIYLLLLGRPDEARTRMQEQHIPVGMESYVLCVRIVFAAQDRDYERVATLLDDAPDTLTADLGALVDLAVANLAERPDLVERCRAIPISAWEL